MYRITQMYYYNHLLVHSHSMPELINCVVTNFRLSVTTPLNVEVSPAMLSVHMGGAAEFRCIVTSQGNQIGPQFITWYKVMIYYHYINNVTIT